MDSRRIALLAAVGLVSGLASTLLGRPPETPPVDPPADPDAGVLPGLCEASAVVMLEGAILVGDNETETQVFRFDQRFSALPPLRLSAEIEDIEALVALPEGGLWVVGSQSANKKGEREPLREQVMVQGQAPITPDLSACGPCEAARGLPPKQGGLSVEGAASWQGSLWLGLRSPLVEGKALLLRMEGDPARGLVVAEQVPVDLAGQGVRDLAVVDGALWILAGPTGAGPGEHQLYRLNTLGEAPTLLPTRLPAGAEGVVADGKGSLIVVTDGDGQPGSACAAPATWTRLPLP